MYKAKDDNLFLDGDAPRNDNTVKKQETDDDNASTEIANMVIEIARDEDVRGERLLQIYHRLCELYSKGNRHSYSAISSAIQKNMKDGTITISKLRENMETFLQLVQKKRKQNNINKDTDGSFNKLYDHVILECNRMTYIAEISEDLAKQQEVVKKQVNSAVRDIKKLYADLIGIVSIFVAIFALITVNANIAFKLTTSNMKGIFSGIVFMNVFVVICIIILLVSVRVLIINNLTKK